MDASVNRIPSSKDEKAFLIAIKQFPATLTDIEYSLQELNMLVKTAGGIIEDSIIINRAKIDASYIIGKGYLQTLKEKIDAKKIKLVVFDLNNIRPAQIRNLEEALKCRVIGRQEVILDIFARRAKSAESKIQVELAQLNYILPRLKGYGGVLSRLGGGIGTRGPGEKMLETDRRHILKRVSTLKKNLKKFEKHRDLIRKSRKNSECIGAVTGYTNAGKSTLINYLAKDDLFVENRLFATLDSYTRTVYIGNRQNVLLTDTVGFIRNLPTHLVASFRSTLEEIHSADFIVHVVEISATDIEQNIKTVEEELLRLESNNKPIIMFFNKIDVVNDDILSLIKGKFPEAIFGSAFTGEGTETLIEQISNIYKKLRIERS